MRLLVSTFLFTVFLAGCTEEATCPQSCNSHGDCAACGDRNRCDPILKSCVLPPPDTGILPDTRPSPDTRPLIDAAPPDLLDDGATDTSGDATEDTGLDT